MKIAINGDIIDTENIYKITKIREPFYEYEIGFKIKMFNNKDINIGLLDFEWNGKFSEKKTGKAKIKLTLLRKQIINIWSNNQSKIPQFDI